jgi:hypothetical protein
LSWWPLLQDELEAKFGLSFILVDRDYLATLRRERGYTANPWLSGSRFIISHSLMGDETYVGGLRDVLGDFRAQALLILDEAHHAAPASGSRYAIDSQFTRGVRGLASRFEHRLFLSATPHNGHSNSFSSLLEILDSQRFTRGVPVLPGELDAVMVRRLKADLRHFGERFPERVVEPILLDGLRDDAPELVLSGKLAEYGEITRARATNLPPRQAGNVRLAFVGLQQRLLSSIAAFARTLEVHRKGLVRTALQAPTVPRKRSCTAGPKRRMSRSKTTARNSSRMTRTRPLKQQGPYLLVFLISPSWTRCWRSPRNMRTVRMCASPGLPTGSAPTWRLTDAGTVVVWSSSPNTKTPGAGLKSG